MAEFNFDGLLGNLFGGGDSELEKLLTAKQREQLGLQSTLSAAAALLKAGGRSPQRIGLGQALGSALEAGQGAYEKGTTNAFQQMLLGQKLKEGQQELAGNEAWRKLIGGQGQPTPPLTPDQAAILAPVSVAGKFGPTPERAQLAAQMPAPVATSTDPLAFLNPLQRSLIGGMPRKEGLPEVLKIAQSQAEFGESKPVVINGKTVMVQYNKMGQSRIDPNVMPYEAQSPDIRAVEYISGKPLAGTGQPGIEDVGKYRQQIATRVDIKPVLDMTGGQEGFTNEMKLAGAFKGEPIYKEYQGMQTAFNQVNTALDQGSPIGDLAGATKMMKLMDEGSVVRETELALAMAAAGRMDRLKNYLSNAMTGQKLTPTQREDFKSLSSELYAAAGQAYNKKRDEYQQFGESYKFKNLSTALGAPATIPSIMRTRPGAAPSGGGAVRPSLGNIFQVPGG
jgi:hypothetical protein